MKAAATFTALALIFTAVPAAAQAPSPAITAAVADDARPAADRERDAHRKPAEIVAFAGVKPGDIVAEMAPGGGYYTRILAKAVGPNGKVYALVSPSSASRPGGLDAINAIVAQYGNVEVVTADLTSFTVPEPVDLVWTTENYHDFHNGQNANVAGVNQAAFAALKPGGLYFIEDHAAKDGTGVTTTSTLHRIDPAAVKSEAIAAGFTLDGESNVLANPADPKDVRVFDPAVGGVTEKFALRFKKPG
jgi:predicted methyltransferase